ncbi:MAG: hypothetical protein M1520_02055 [Candidatus Marsarchaeota archaeon]|jgi:hypothetical protein|nr:hypothetical protein [Candidatus Marsarchaeota archaeon]
MNTVISEKSVSKAGAAGILSESSINRRDYGYREAIRKAMLWSGLGQLKDAEKNGVISHKIVETLRNSIRD